MGIANRGIHIGCTKLYIANIFILYMFLLKFITVKKNVAMINNISY